MDERRCLEVLTRMLRCDARLQAAGRAYFTKEEVAALDHAIATIERERWRPIESAPRTGIAVLLHQPWKSGRNCTVIGHYANGWVDRYCEDMQPEPTHWRPLPDSQPDGQEGS